MKNAQEDSQKVEKITMALTPKNSQRGQMLVVVMMMITTVIIMFGMTVSVGHLVQSKVNLQTSVDLASLSAASYQARHMNAMSVANYRIRAVLKFFLLDSYVTQGRFNNKFESEVMSGGAGTIQDPIGSFSVCQQARNYNPVRAINEPGRGVDPDTNVCKNFLGDGQSKIITPIMASPFPGFNPIYIFINMTLLAIAAEFQKACGEWQGQNEVWAKWAIKRAVEDTDQQAAQMAKVAEAFKRDLAGGGNSPMLGTPGLAAQTAVATFRSNLIGSLMQSGGDLNSLLYLNNGVDRYLEVTDLQKSEKAFGLSYVDARWSGGCEIINNDGGARATARSMTQGYSKRGGGGAGGGKTISVGVVANADSPSILFWPRGIEPAMVAIAAAKPFGSRIGPPASYFASEGGNGWGNVATFPGDTAGQLQEGGFGHKEILRYGMSQMPAPGSGVASSRPKDQFAAAAYAPTIFDSMYYSIFSPDSPFAPGDVIPNLTINSPLNDRGGTLPDPYSWSMPPLSKHYRPAAMNSAWTPDPENEPRSGYQIKLISIDDLCNISTSDALQKICPKEGTRLL